MFGWVLIPVISKVRLNVTVLEWLKWSKCFAQIYILAASGGCGSSGSIIFVVVVAIIAAVVVIVIVMAVRSSSTKSRSLGCFGLC